MHSRRKKGKETKKRKRRKSLSQSLKVRHEAKDKMFVGVCVRVCVCACVCVCLCGVCAVCAPYVCFAMIISLSIYFCSLWVSVVLFFFLQNLCATGLTTRV